MIALGLLLGVAAFVRWYVPARTGKVLLLADLDGGPLSVELISATGAAIAGPFPAPSAQPIRLPAGPGRLRVSSPGRPSTLWHVEVEADRLTEVHVRAAEPLWEEAVHLPRREADAGLSPRPYFEALRLGGRRGARADVVLKDPPRALAGDTGRTLWETRRDWPVPDAPNAPAGSTPAVTRMRLLPAAPDLDGDGTGDLVWLFDPYPAEVPPPAVKALQLSAHPCILAVSGRTRRPLWSFPPPLPAPEELRPQLLHGARGVFFPLEAAVVGTPALVDLDGDGVADLVATLASLSGARRLVALSGRTGLPLWQFDPGPGLEDPNGQPEGAAQVHRCKHGLTVFWQRESRLFCLDVRTGRPRRPPLLLHCRPICPPRFVDLDGDGEPAAVLLADAGSDLLAVSAVAPMRGDVLWRRVIPQADWARVLGTRKSGPRGFYRDSDPEYPLIADLDGTGRPVLVLPQWADADGGGFSRRMWVEAWEGASGRTLWQRELARYAWMPAAVPPRLIAGPDFDGDGIRDVVAVSAVKDLPALARELAPREAGENWLYFDALSGADGRSQWWRRFPVQADLRPGPLAWWYAGGTLPLLLAPLSTLRENGARVWIVEGDTGRLRVNVADLESPQLADLDGDGVADLCGLVRGDTEGKGMLCALSGQALAELGQAAALPPEPEDDPRLLRPLPWAGTARNPTESAAIAGLASFAFALFVIPTAWLRGGRRGSPVAAVLLACAGTWLPAILCLAARRVGAPRWTDFGILLPLLALFAVVPPMLIVQAAVRRQWAHSLALFGVLIGMTMLAAGVLLVLDLPSGVPAPRYSLRGWYLMGFFGTYAAGLLLGPLALVRSDWGLGRTGK
jgi:hypothetical protein